MKKYILYSLSFLLLVTCTKDDVPEIDAIRTIIVYMAADNDLSYDAYADIREMESGFEEKASNLIVFIDPADDMPQILQIERGGNTRIKTYAEFNSTDAADMQEVLNDIIEMYPAESYGLILWSHGTSWLPAGSRLKSFGEDNGHRMDISALAAALPISFEFILIDACLMGSVEVAYELKDKTDYMIASSTETIYEGFPFIMVNRVMSGSEWITAKKWKLPKYVICRATMTITLLRDNSTNWYIGMIMIGSPSGKRSRKPMCCIMTMFRKMLCFYYVIIQKERKNVPLRMKTENRYGGKYCKQK